jgi:uncharacterized repeat protein (TIGR01451 family)
MKTNISNNQYFKTILKTNKMKKLLFLMLLFTGIVNAQIVNIPDNNFKAKLIALGVDTNGDGQIQSVEALAKTTLDVSNSNISNLTGIRSFLNLTALTCNNNQITFLNVSGLNNLNTIYCQYNQIGSINLSGTVLYRLDCGFNQLTVLNITGLNNLQYLKCNNNLISTLSFDNSITYLAEVICSFNQLTAINFNNVATIAYGLVCSNNLLITLNIPSTVSLVNCEYNQLTNLNVPQGVGLLYCNNNLLTTLDFSNRINAYELDCSNNLLTNLNVTGSHFARLNCKNNFLTSLDLTNVLAQFNDPNNAFDLSFNQILNLTFLNTNIDNFKCNNNQLTTLDLTNCIINKQFECSNNQLTNINFSNSITPTVNLKNNLLTSIDISNCLYINSLDCSNNNLNTIFAKNGRNEFINFTNNPNLTFICADDEQVSSFASVALPTTSINSYCNFAPGGLSNKIVGISRLDSDNNGCNNLDFGFNNLKINVTDGFDSGSTFTNNTGNYSIFTQSLDYTLTPSLENPTYFNVSPATSVVSFPTNNFLTQTQDYCITSNGIRPDLEVVIFPAQQTIPYSEAEFVIVYKNKGNQVLSGTVDFTFNDDICDLATSNPVADNQTAGLLNWNYSNLLPFESRSINLKFQLNDATFPFYLNLGDNLPVSATVNPVVGDETPLDNTFSLNQPLVETPNLNFITCLEGNNVAPSQIGKYLHYSVQFENSGTENANNVVVKNVIDTTKFDISSLQVISSSAGLRTVITNNIVEFIFENINLARKSGTPPVGGHGDVLFKIKTKPTLPSGSSVVNNASIYFDYEMAILTNNAITTFATLSSQVFKIDESVSIYPNPTSSKININANNNIKSIELYDVQGRVLENILNANSLDISAKNNGIYFLKITTEKGSKVEKVIKE